MMLSGGGVGAPAGFLARISQLEREISFLKQKVEDDAHWKHILGQWILDQFGFDVQGALLLGSRSRRQYHSSTTAGTAASARVSASMTSVTPGRRGGGGVAASSAAKNLRSTQKETTSQMSRSKVNVKVEQAEPMGTRSSGDAGYLNEEEDDISPAGFDMDEDDENDTEQDHCFGGVMEDGMEVNVHPKDLIISPDICSDAHHEDEGSNAVGQVGSVRKTLRKRTPATRYATRKASLRREDQDTDNEDILEEIAGDVGDNNQSDDGSSDSSSEELQRRPHRKMEWTLVGTYPNVQTMKQQFNLREWGLSTKQINEGSAKIYYYCKECRKHGPGRLLIRYRDENSEVEILKNQLEHDHSTKKRLTEEMKVEIVNLFKAGIADSPKILAALRVSKPHMRQPTVKQVCHILKPFRKVERKHKLKEKKKAAKEKEQLKLSNSLDLISGGGRANKPSKKCKKGAKNDSIGSSLSSLPPNFPLSAPSTSTSSSSSGSLSNSQLQQHLSPFMSNPEDRPRDFQRPQIVSVTGFPNPSQQQLQQFYQHQQQHNSFDPGSSPPVHLGQHYP